MAKGPRSKEPDGRGARLVGSIVDPAADDGLSLSGPGAPGGSVPGEKEHPVKARLLARARLARGEATPDDHRLLGTSAAGHVPDTRGSFEQPLVGPRAALGPSDQTALGSSAQRQPALGQSAFGASGQPRSDLVPPPTLPARRASSPAEVPPYDELDEAPRTRRTSEEGPDSAEKPASSDESPTAMAMSPTPSPGAVAQELERIIGRTTSSDDRARPALSPNLVAVLSALLGLSVLGTLGLFLEPTTFESTTTTQTAAPAPVATNEPEVTVAPVERPLRKKLPGPWRIADDQHKPDHRVLSGKIGKLAFLKAIEQVGLPKNEAYRAYGALKETLDLDHCSPKDVFRALVVGREKRLVAFEYEKSKEEVYQAKVGDAGKLVGQKLNLAVERNQIRLAFVYDGSSFDESAKRAGFDEGLSQVAEQAFRGHLGLRELKAGDRLRIIAQEVTVLGEFARYAGIEAIEIVRQGRDPQRIYYFSHPEEGGYFDATGRAPYEGGWRKPIPGAPVTSKFNMKRLHPVLKKVMPHTGTDFGAPTGTPIGSTAPGTVSFIGNGGPSGNLVKVKHDGGYESGYAHLSRFEAGLKVGDPVERLETVGYCGSTGRSTGPHLHFTMKKNGEYIDPESLNLDGLRVLGTAHRSAFAEVRQKYDAILEAIALPEVPPSLLAQSGAATGAEADAHAAGNDESVEGAPGESDSPAGMPLGDAAPPEPGPPTVAAAPAKPAPALPAGKPAAAVSTSSIFLSDADLLKMQGAVHDGEVSE